MPDPVPALRAALRPPAAPDLVPEVRRRLRRRHRTRVAGLALATTTALTATIAAWSQAPLEREPQGAPERADVAAVATRATPSRGSEPAGSPSPLSTVRPTLTGKDRTDVDEERYPPGRNRLSAFVSARPGIFTGQYGDGKTWVVVLGPQAVAEGVDRWRDELQRIGGRTKLRIETCDVSQSDLLAIMDAIRALPWPSGPRPTYATGTEPQTCKVLLTSNDLTDDDLALVRERFGDRVRHEVSEVGRAPKRPRP